MAVARLGQREKGWPAPGRSSQICVFGVVTPPLIDGESPQQSRSSSQLCQCLRVETVWPLPDPPVAGRWRCDRPPSPRPGRRAPTAGRGGQPGVARVPPSPGVTCPYGASRTPAGRSGPAGQAGRRPRLPQPRRCPEPAGATGAGAGGITPAHRGPAEPIGRRNHTPGSPRRRPGPAAPPAHRPGRRCRCCLRHPCCLGHTCRISASRRWCTAQCGLFPIRRPCNRIRPSARPSSFRHHHPSRRG